jgi:hypothetical protein
MGPLMAQDVIGRVGPELRQGSHFLQLLVIQALKGKAQQEDLIVSVCHSYHEKSIYRTAAGMYNKKIAIPGHPVGTDTY